MAFRLGNGIWSGVFAVPDAIVDDHLKLASGLSVKVLLLLLRHGGDISVERLTTVLGHAAVDIQDAVNYWVQVGVIVSAEESATTVASDFEPANVPDIVNKTDQIQSSQSLAAPVPPPTPALSPEPASQPVTKVGAGRRQRITTQMINEMAKEDTNIAYLLQEVQAVLGSTLTPVATDTVVALYTYHGMQPDLILMLIHYCVSIGKNSMRYIEKVAANWLDRGIDTHEKVEAEILRLTQSDEIEYKIKSAFGIYDRNLITSEKKYIQTWVNEYQMDIALIQLAYERTIERKGKLSFPYISGILTNWHKKGVHTPAQAMQELREKPANKNHPSSSDSSYDMDELENMITYGEI